MSQKVSLVLSGGGARGLAHIGVIEQLEKEGFEIVSIVGTSMGAVVGGVYAAGKMNEFKEWMYSLDKMDILKLIDVTFHKQGLIKGDKVFEKMNEFLPDMNIENLNIEYAAVATDIIQNKEVVFRKGSLYEAIRASIAIPTLFTPVKDKDALYIDGGVLNNVPISHAKIDEESILVVVNVNADIPISPSFLIKKEKKESLYRRKIKKFQEQLQLVDIFKTKEELGYFDIINKTIHAMMYKMADETIEKHSPDILISISKDTANIFDFYKAEELVDLGAYVGKENIHKYKL